MIETKIIRMVQSDDATSLQKELKSSQLDELRDEIGKSLLHYAAMSCSIETVKLLIEMGVSIDSVDEYGNTALSDAVYYCDNSIVANYLISNGADPERKNLHGVSPRELSKSIAGKSWTL